ncbi:PQQ-binding-like beta-propeller repeat protein [Microbispora hainanensis]|uniref:PQQ-binding-like beta-propeller repeat protein n=1 Tax=Microbispora hainanensis TaxID=568844 RepID=A0ABZ1SL07_9ACTN|nr:PQQ-binding-like beta-propeller repeat protein [Microbispora hainanensis]
MAGWTLAIDFGTCFTTVATAEGGRVEIVEIENSRYLPSLVCLGEDGGLMVGRAAVSRAAVHPELAEPVPKRALLGAPYVRLGHRDVAVIEVVAAVLAKASGEAVRRRGGRAPGAVVMTHPAAWGETERALLSRAAERAGLCHPRLGRPSFMAEPVAAAARYATDSLPVGGHVAVFDFGGGTLDTAVLRRTATGFELAGPPGGDPHLGGLDLDEALLALVEEEAARVDPQAWDALVTGDSLRSKRARAQLRRDITEAKEALSDHLSHSIVPDGFSAPIRISRAAFEARIDNLLARGVAELLITVEQAGITPADLAAVYLTGGSSRVPRVAYLVADMLGVTPAVQDDPKCVVVLGALQDMAPAPTAVPRLRILTPQTAYQTGRVPPEPAPARPAARTALPWKATHGADGRVLAAREGSVYVGGTRITAYDSEAGIPVWSSRDTPPLERLALSGNTLYGRAGDVLLALDAGSGDPRWAYRASGTVVPAGDVVYIHEPGRLLALGADNGRPVWHRSAGAYGIADPGEGVVYAAERVEVTALDTKTGEALWRFRRASRAAPAVLGGVLYGTGDGKLFALDAGTGELLWEAASGPGAPVLSDDTVIVAGGGRVSSYDPRTGRLRWKATTSTPAALPPSAGSGVVCVREDTGCLCLDAADGRVRWRARGIRGVPIIAADAVYAVVTSPGHTSLAALGLASGATRWAIDFGRAAVAEPLLMDGLLHTLTATTGSTSTVLAIDAATGRI